LQPEMTLPAEKRRMMNMGRSGKGKRIKKRGLSGRKARKQARKKKFIPKRKREKMLRRMSGRK